MLRMLMSCVFPDRALRFQSALTDKSTDQSPGPEAESHGSSALFSALVSHGVAPGEPNTVPLYRA